MEITLPFDAVFKFWTVYFWLIKASQQSITSVAPKGATNAFMKTDRGITRSLPSGVLALPSFLMGG
jgi:hypothetical protein